MLRCFGESRVNFGRLNVSLYVRLGVGGLFLGRGVCGLGKGGRFGEICFWCFGFVKFCLSIWRDN